jgi:hypothetical protein
VAIVRGIFWCEFGLEVVIFAWRFAPWNVNVGWLRTALTTWQQVLDVQVPPFLICDTIKFNVFGFENDHAHWMTDIIVKLMLSSTVLFWWFQTSILIREMGSNHIIGRAAGHILFEGLSIYQPCAHINGSTFFPKNVDGQLWPLGE